MPAEIGPAVGLMAAADQSHLLGEAVLASPRLGLSETNRSGYEL